MKVILFLLLVSGQSYTQAQFHCSGESLNIYSSINKVFTELPKQKNSNTRILQISKDSILTGFQVLVSDKSYKIVELLVFFEFDDCPMNEISIKGDMITPQNVTSLRQYEKRHDGYIEMICIWVEKNGKRFNVPGFSIFPNEWKVED